MNELNITIIQSELHWQNETANLQMFEDKIGEIKNETDLILLPEMFTTGFSMDTATYAKSTNGNTIKWMQKIAAHKNCVVSGSIMYQENNHFYNRLLWVEPNGTFYKYDKRHLFALAHEDKYFTKGSNTIILNYKGWNIMPLICYDLRFPVWSRRTAAKNYDLLLYVANWPEQRISAWQNLLPARAIENQCYVAAVNRIGNDGNNIYYNGRSTVLDYLGNSLMGLKNDIEFTETVTLYKNKIDDFREKFAFYNDADDFKISDN